MLCLMFTATGVVAEPITPDQILKNKISTAKASI